MTASTSSRALTPVALKATRWRPSWRLSTRLSVAFGLVLGLLLVITAVALHRMQRIDAHTTRMQEVNHSRIAVIQTMMNAVNEVTVAMLGVTLVVDEVDAKEQADLLAKGLERYRNARAQFKTLSEAAPDPEQDAMLAALEKVATRGLDSADYVRDALRSGNSNLGNIFRQRNPTPLQHEWLDQLRAQAQHEAQGAAAQGQAIQAEFALARQWLLGAAGAAIAISVVAGILILRSVTRPLAQAIDHAQRIAQGDLTGDIVATGTDETSDLLTALGRMQQQLRTLVASIHDSAGGITLASREIAQGNQDLSTRTEQAASDLQSTAISVGELAGVVRASAASAAQADALARQAASTASQGGEVVASVETVMDEILSGARRIADIVGVIDSIAFQTNILALNAAVEAAHAGSQGRGFAVVATEVRSLAQRVVAAAHDIKQLIELSLASANHGSQLARNAGETMQHIVTSVQRVAATIGEVATAAGTQSSGIEDVSAAVGRLDDMTQRNAALVEQSAAAAQALEHQAVQLEELVGVFHGAPSQGRHAGAPGAALKYESKQALALAGNAPAAMVIGAT